MAIRQVNWKLILYTGTIAGFGFAALLFAGSQSLRTKSSSRILAVYDAIFYGSDKITITRMDVPERKLVAQRYENEPKPIPAPIKPLPQPIRFKLSPRPIAKASKRVEEVERPRLHRNETPVEHIPQDQTEAVHDTAPPLQQQKGKEQQEAYSILMTESKKMADLVANKSANLKFKSWAVVKNDGEDYWIDVVLVDKSISEEVHYIWKVNIASKDIKPESHQAKKLYVM